MAREAQISHIRLYGRFGGQLLLPVESGLPLNLENALDAAGLWDHGPRAALHNAWAAEAEWFAQLTLPAREDEVDKTLLAFAFLPPGAVLYQGSAREVAAGRALRFEGLLKHKPSGEATADITRLQGNLLTAALPKACAALGEVQLRGVHFLSFEEAELVADGAALEARIFVDVHAPGRYTFFHRMLDADGAIVHDTQFDQRLVPNDVLVRHPLPDMLDKGTLVVWAQRNGLRCDRRTLSLERAAAAGGDTYGYLWHAAPYLLPQEALRARLAALHQAGFDHVQVIGLETPMFYECCRAQGLAAYAQAEDERLARLPCACAAGTAPFAPENADAAGLAAQGFWADRLELQALFGSFEAEDAVIYARLARWWQGEKLERAIEEARRLGAPLALVDAPLWDGDTPRPAYHALCRALAPVALGAVCPPFVFGGRESRFELFLNASSEEKHEITVRARLMDGTLLAENLFEGQGSTALGMLCVPVPEEALLFVLELSCPKASRVYLIGVGGDAPLQALRRLPPAFVSLAEVASGQALYNDSPVAALGVYLPTCRVMLPLIWPYDKAALPLSAGPDTPLEGLNLIQSVPAAPVRDIGKAVVI